MRIHSCLAPLRPVVCLALLASLVSLPIERAACGTEVAGLAGTRSATAQTSAPPAPPAAPPAATSEAGTPAQVSYAQPTVPFDEERDLATYRQHVMLLSDPFLEGRGPGTRGNKIACDYLEFHFKRLGLHPGFEAPVPAGEQRAAGADATADANTHGSPDDLPPPIFTQEFQAGSEATVSEASFTVGDETFTHDRDFTVLGFSADATLTEAELAFVGYSLEESGKDGVEYSSYAAGEDLGGKVAVMFRFEPMDDQGRSLWKASEDDKSDRSGWTPAASLSGKIQAALKANAGAIVLINTPGADDPRINKLDSTAATAGWSRKLEIPVLMVTSEAGDRLLRAADADRRGALDFRRLADMQTAPGAVALNGAKAALTAKLARKPRSTWNVGAILPGRGDLAMEVVVVGAHYDHVGYGYTGGSRRGELGVIHPGADDNASGTAGLLLIADLLSRAYAQFPPERQARSIMFLGFSAEEMGLIGSRHFVRNAPYDSANIYAMLNLDMIGRAKDRSLEIAGVGTGEGLPEMVVPGFEADGFTVRQSPGGRGPSDHASFYAAGVPVLHFFSGLHDEYHTPRDTVDLLNIPVATDIAQGVARTALAMAISGHQLEFTSTDRGGAGASSSMANIKVRFGIAPGNYADGESGVLVGEVFPNTSAAIGGVQEGDRLSKWNGKDIADVEGWMKLLGEHKPDDLVEVTVQRKGQTLVLPITLKAREQTDQ